MGIAGFSFVADQAAMGHFDFSAAEDCTASGIAIIIVAWPVYITVFTEGTIVEIGFAKGIIQPQYSSIQTVVAPEAAIFKAQVPGIGVNYAAVLSGIVVKEAVLEGSGSCTAVHIYRSTSVVSEGFVGGKPTIFYYQVSAFLFDRSARPGRWEGIGKRIPVNQASA